MKKSYASSPHAKPRRGREESMRTGSKKTQAKSTTDRPLTAAQKRELSALAKLPDSQIDTSNIPELPPEAWESAMRGRFYRPFKQAVSLRLDADVLHWLKAAGRGYQTRVNRILREKMLSELRNLRA